MHPAASRRSVVSLIPGHIRRLPPLGPPATAMPAPANSAGVESGPLSEADDETLARALIAQDPQARAVVWCRFKPLAARMAARFFSSRADIDDVIQEVFVCLLSRV